MPLAAEFFVVVSINLRLPFWSASIFWSFEPVGGCILSCIAKRNMKKKKNIGKSNFYLAFIEREKKHEQLDRVKSVPDEMLQDTTILV